MKNMFVVRLAIAALLAVGSLAHAQDEITPIPAVDAPDAIQVTNQASVSDNVALEDQVDEVAPVVPVPESTISSSAVATGSDCVGCGQASPIFSGRIVGGRLIAAPISSGCSSCAQVSSGCSSCAQVSSGCSSCAQVSTGCSACCPGSGCGAVQTTSYIQPTTNCACGQIGQVSYDQPLYQSQVPSALASTPISIMSSPIVNPAPSPSTLTPSALTPSPVYTPVTTGCACDGGSTAYAPASVGTSYFNSSCNTCTSTRGRLRGRWFRR